MTATSTYSRTVDAPCIKIDSAFSVSNTDTSWDNADRGGEHKSPRNEGKR